MNTNTNTTTNTNMNTNTNTTTNTNIYTNTNGSIMQPVKTRISLLQLSNTNTNGSIMQIPIQIQIQKCKYQKNGFSIGNVKLL